MRPDYAAEDALDVPTLSICGLPSTSLRNQDVPKLAARRDYLLQHGAAMLRSGRTGPFDDEEAEANHFGLCARVRDSRFGASHAPGAGGSKDTTHAALPSLGLGGGGIAVPYASAGVSEARCLERRGLAAGHEDIVDERWCASRLRPPLLRARRTRAPHLTTEWKRMEWMAESGSLLGRKEPQRTRIGWRSRNPTQHEYHRPLTSSRFLLLHCRDRLRSAYASLVVPIMMVNMSTRLRWLCRDSLNKGCDGIPSRG